MRERHPYGHPPGIILRHGMGQIGDRFAFDPLASTKEESRFSLAWWYLVPEAGVEPARHCCHGILSQIEKGRKP